MGKGIIIKKLDEPRSYTVKIDDKTIINRNQIHMTRGGEVLKERDVY